MSYWGKLTQTITKVGTAATNVATNAMNSQLTTP